MGARRESVIDWLVLGLMMRILIGAILVSWLCGVSIGEGLRGTKLKEIGKWLRMGGKCSVARTFREVLYKICGGKPGPKSFELPWPKLF